jgi:hypothetical protein
MNFEVHISIKTIPSRVETLQGDIEKEKPWSFSRITGDPELGQDDVVCYATAHFSDAITAIEKMDRLAYYLQDQWFDVQRKKVEIVMSDERKVNGVWTRIGV